MSPSTPGARAPRRLSLPALAIAWLAAGCVSSAEPVYSGGGTATVMNTSRGRSATVNPEERFAAPTTLDVPVERAWPALLTALPALGIPIETVDPETRTAGTPRTSARGRFAGRPISAYLTCGGTAGVAEVADAHAVTLAVLARLRPAAGGGSQLQVEVAGSAKDPFTSVPARACATRGTLEMRVDSTVRAMLRSP